MDRSCFVILGKKQQIVFLNIKISRHSSTKYAQFYYNFLIKRSLLNMSGLRNRHKDVVRKMLNLSEAAPALSPTMSVASSLLLTSAARWSYRGLYKHLRQCKEKRRGKDKLLLCFGDLKGFPMFILFWCRKVQLVKRSLKHSRKMSAEGFCGIMEILVQWFAK